MGVLVRYSFIPHIGLSVLLRFQAIKLFDLEHLTKPKSDQSSGKGGKGQMDISPAFITDEETPVSMEPGKSPLDNPTVFSKMSRAVHPSSGNSVFYAPYCVRLPAKWKIISFISVKFLRTTSRSPMQISQGRQDDPACIPETCNHSHWR